MKKKLLTTIFFLSSTIVYCQQNFNGMMSTYADTTASGYNGIIETQHTYKMNFNGIYTTFADSIANDGFNGIIETVLDDATFFKSKLSPIYFDFNSTTANYKSLINNVKDLPTTAKLYIVGYADTKGSIAANQEISKMRAKNVAAILRKLGFTCKYEGKGSDASVAADKARRCDIFILN